MSKNWDSGENSAHATPNGIETGRSIEYSTTSNVYAWVWVDAADDLWLSVGEDSAWVTTQLSGVAGPLGHAVNVGYAKVAIDQNTDKAHIIYYDIDNNFVYHARCEDILNAVVGASWTQYGGPGVNYQRVCNCGNPKPNASICVDGNVNNGANKPHVIMEITAGAGVVQYAYGVGANGAFTPANNITLANAGEATPTMICTSDEGRELYVFWVNGTDIECVKCLDAANPLLPGGGSWGGPVAGAGGGPDIAITGGMGDAPSPPSASWWWDADERVIVATSLVGGTNLIVTNYWDETAGPAAWAGQAPAAPNPGFGVSSGVMIVNRGNANKWTMYAHDNAAGLEYALKDNTYSFAGATWYDQATTGPVLNSYMSCEWRHLEVISANHSVVVWVDDATNLWYGETRINTSTVPTMGTPTGSTYHNELETIEFDWTFNDTEADIQRQYYAEIDDDVAFGSPVADPGSNFRLSTWTTSALDDQTLNASVLAGTGTYYWRVKTRDSEYGTEADPDSESGYSASGTFRTTPQIVLNIISVSQQVDKDVYVDMDITVEIEDDDADDDNHIEFVAAEYDTGGGFVAMTNIAAENTPDGDGDTDPTDIDPLDIGSAFRYTYAWNADADLAAEFDSDVDIRITFRYLADAHGQGNDTDTDLNNAIDFKPPTQAIGVPNGTTITIPKPTLNATVSDTTGYKVKFDIANNIGYAPIFESSGYLGAAVDSYAVVARLTSAGVWYFRAKSKDTTVSENENAAWVTGSFTYTPPPNPIECQDGTFTLKIDPTKLWVGSEFDTLAMGDVLGTVKFEENYNAPNRLEFTLNNYDGRYVDPTSDFVVQKGDEVKLVKGDKAFYGTIVNLTPHTRLHRELKVYCESFASAAEREPIQIRILSTEESGLYFEDYIKIAAQTSGLAPKWFKIVDVDGNEIFPESASNKTPVLSGNPIIMNKVSFVELLNEYSSRTGKVCQQAYLNYIFAYTTSFLSISMVRLPNKEGSK